MGSPWFNDDQCSWTEYLASVPRDLKCRCGWDLKGDCRNPACQLTREEVQAELDRLGIDVRPGVQRVLSALKRAKERA